MSENVGGSDIFGSGGHIWLWGPRLARAKTIRSVGISGAARFSLGNFERPFQIRGKGGPALLKASGASKAAADTALNALWDAIEQLKDDGTISSWEDDQGRSGDALVITELIPAARRLYGKTGDTHYAWQHYLCSGVELEGAF